jgi:hypothetical protein
VFGFKCWEKIPTAQGGSKLDPRSVECRLLGYTSGSGNYRVQEVGSRRVFVSRDVIFDEGKPSRTSADVEEETEMLLNFDMNIVPSTDGGPEQTTVNHGDIPDQNANHVDTPIEPRRSTRVPQPTNASIQSMEYQRCEAEGRGIGREWATNTRNPKASMVIDYTDDDKNAIACLTDTKSSHHIPRSYKHAMATDQERWMLPMKVEMDTLK